MASNEDTELDQAKEIGRISSEVHTLNTLLTKLYEKFDTLVDKLQPKPLNFNTVAGSIVAVLTAVAILFGSVLYIASSSNAPIMAQMTQLNESLKTLNSNTVQNATFIQLTNQKISGIENNVENNKNTLNWLIRKENIPKQLTQVQGEINTLKMQMERVVSQAHENK